VQTFGGFRLMAARRAAGASGKRSAGRLDLLKG